MLSRRFLGLRRFYALIWKDFVVHKRHPKWTLLEITVPVLVCAMAILSNTHQGRARLENERTFDSDDFERIYGDLTPTRHRLLIAPNSTFTRELVNQIDDGAVSVELCNSEADLVDLIKQEIPVSLDQIKRLIPDSNTNVTIGGVVIRSDELYSGYHESNSKDSNKTKISLALGSGDIPDSNYVPTQSVSNDSQKRNYLYYEVMSKLENQTMKIPLNLDMFIRAKDFRLGPEPFPKKYSLGPFIHGDHYIATFFMASQIMVSRAYMNLLVQYINSTGSLNATEFAIPSNEEIIGQRMPYPKFVTHKRLKESTLRTFVAGSQKQKPFVLTMDFCLTIGFLVTAIFLAKRIVDEKKSRVRDMLRLVGISNWTYYGSHVCNTMIIMIVQCAIITILFTSHNDAPAQHIDPTLMFSILFLYALSAIMFVLFLSACFTSSTKAIIFTSLAWLGLPEVLDRFFKLNSGVVESSGSIALPEEAYLLLSLIPNFALRLTSRILTECDIYGEFYDKKQLYGEYRGIWPNVWTVLPMYKFLNIGYMMLATLFAIPLYAALIYFVDITSSSQISLAGLGADSPSKRSDLMSFKLIPKIFYALTVGLLVAPFKLISSLLSRSYGETGRHQQTRSEESMSGSVMNMKKYKTDNGHINSGFATSLHDLGINEAKNSPSSILSSGVYGDLQSKSQGLAGKRGCNAICNNQLDVGCYPSLHRSEEEAVYFEKAPKMLRIGLSIRNLCKTFHTNSSKIRQIYAVRNVSLDAYYSQILVLLGHNGAGKTTLIDIISGHNHKTSGQVYIDGYSIDSDPDEARRRVGFCPQFDVLFERLTVYEHLYFYGVVKGARSGLRREIESLLQQSGLDVHRNKLSKTLSGGYKRKLSLAIAMIADSKVLILDEPTSGMDPESRRKVWDFLQLIRHDRLILMTTHHMEEADALGDRVAVMSSGQVKCCGSALFLKRIFNAGYHLRISKSNTWNQIAFDEYIGSKHNLDDKLENFTPHELMYQFDADETSTALPPLFDDLEEHRERIGIFGFGITVSTMDDVFMKIGMHFKDTEAEEMQAKFKLAQKSESSKISTKFGQHQITRISGLKEPSLMVECRERRVEGKKLFKQHLRALLAKRFHHARKNWFQMFWIMGISLACVVSVVVLIDMVIFREELTPEWSRPMTLAGAGYGTKTTGVYQYETVGDNYDSLRDAAFPMNSTDSSNLITNNLDNSAITTIPTNTSSGASPRDLTTTVYTVNETATDISGRSRRWADQNPPSLNASEEFLKHWLFEARANGVRDLLTYTDINTQMIDLLTRQFANFREHYIVGGEKTGKKYIAWYSGEASHSFPVSMNIMLNSILKQITDHLEDQGHPVKNSRISLTHIAMAQINTLIAFLPHLGRLINLVFLPFSLAFITSYFVMFPTQERISKSKHLQLMTGVPTRVFWLSHFVFDFIFYAIYTTIVLTIYFVWDRVINDHKIYFANFEHSVALLALVTLFIFGALPLAYIFSFIAKKPTSAFSSFCVLTILTGTATLTLVSLYELKYENTATESIQLAFAIFFWTARLVPSVSLLIGLQKLFALNTTRSICINVSPEVLELLCRYISSPLIDDELRVLRPERCCKQVCNNECYDQWPFFWTGWFGVNVEIAMLIFDACLLWFILILIEHRSLRTRIVGSFRKASLFGSSLSKLRGYRWNVPQFSGGSNRECGVEQLKCRRIIAENRTLDYSLVVSDLTKVYSSNNFRAVDHLSFLVDKQEFFGLLGVNGAGKSTTFKMLTGERGATSGNSWIGPYNLTRSRREYSKRIGYCPQQDALIDSLSGAEMLSLFGRLRGVPEEKLMQLIDDTLNRLGLMKMKHVDCNKYSGGNKRRLAVGMALIGAPEVVFLDEPTSGVDPRSRRRLWSTLIEFQRETKSAIVMTSHSMNECECLCDRVAIMVAGQFKVMGSIQYLRTKLSQGFSLTLKLKPDNLQDIRDLNNSNRVIHDYMLKCFSSSEIELKDSHQTILQYHIQPSDDLTWSKMLITLEQAKRELDLEDYQITSDASLESIFLSLAKQQQLNERK